MTNVNEVRGNTHMNCFYRHLPQDTQHKNDSTQALHMYTAMHEKNQFL